MLLKHHILAMDMMTGVVQTIFKTCNKPWSVISSFSAFDSLSVSICILWVQVPLQLEPFPHAHVDSNFFFRSGLTVQPFVLNPFNLGSSVSCFPLVSSKCRWESSHKALHSKPQLLGLALWTWPCLHASGQDFYASSGSCLLEQTRGCRCNLLCAGSSFLNWK